MPQFAKTLPVLVVAFALSGLWPTAAAAADLSLVEAINMAGRQRMLTQRIVRSYCQVGLQVMPEESAVQLEQAALLFERQLGELKAFVTDPRVRDALGQVDQLWTKFVTIARMPPSQVGARQLTFWDDDLLFASHKVVRLLQDRSGRQIARLVNIAGRQRMLSQRMAKLYMLKEWGLATVSIEQDLDAARNEFAGALALLRDRPENTSEINQALDEVALQWSWFDNALGLREVEAYRLVIADTSETILLMMDRVTKLYEALATP